MKVYFYPHARLRDRQLDTVRNWPAEEVLNPELAEGRNGAQVPLSIALNPKGSRPWRSVLPLINLKKRPAGLAPDTLLYVWGGMPLSGPYIVELDNPFGLTGYNPLALRLYRPLLRKMLLSGRCAEIRCISRACRSSLEVELGRRVYDRASVNYPLIEPDSELQVRREAPLEFLFVSTQFELKAGHVLVRAFHRALQTVPDLRLVLVTHLPESCRHLVQGCPQIEVHAASCSRSEIWERFMRRCQVIVHPTMAESFGMVVLEALARGMAAISTDVYALGELVQNGHNGFLIKPTISVWDGLRPSSFFQERDKLSVIRSLDHSRLEEQLLSSMLSLARDRALLERSCRNSMLMARQIYAQAKSGLGCRTGRPG